VIEYLIEENGVLKEQVRGRRLLLTDDQRRRLAAKGHAVGRKDLEEVATIVAADAILAWHRKLIAQTWTTSSQRPDGPRVTVEIRHMAVRMATENSSWGYRQIQGELKHLRLRVARSTIAEILKENGIKPAPDRPSLWKTFIKSHWGQLVHDDARAVEPSVRQSA
jgi:putative transposase